MKRRLALAVAIAGVVLVMQAPAPALIKLPARLCAIIGMGPENAKNLLSKWGPNARWYDNTVQAIPDCAHMP